MPELPKCVSEVSFVSLEENPVREAQSRVQPKSKEVTTFKKKKPKVKVGHTCHREAWLEHRHRVLNVVSELDTKPPGFQAARLTGVMGLRQNAESYNARTKTNIQMLVEISKTMRTHGVINPFRHERLYTTSSLPMTLKIMTRIDQENQDIAKRIMDVVSEIDTGLPAKDKRPKKSNRLLQPFVMPEKSLEKYKGYNINMPKTDLECWHLLRPQIYLDIYLKGSRPLGRIVVQLYTEAAPVVVLQLVRACMCNRHNSLIIRRLFPNLWLDVELWDNGNGDLNQPMEYDAKIIDHGASSYVLSFSKEHLQGFRTYMSFSISFKPLGVVNGSRVGFGKVVKGTKILDCLQSYGTKNGKLSRSIIFTACGVL
ncbi:uncharacterized protein [Drosophila virilis]|uniref:PPIase cyclophilin-type domain-containing protein n=1 Tax=Drosophila virilis TaxID=7244 RepID=A0A0Q9WNA0_DROVI|nr:uncharacterized protein LOC26531799 [Drosophila virilis]KRF85750.1 uncharacterized protein Dvir_GJ27029 [Drosophila virilis]